MKRTAMSFSKSLFVTLLLSATCAVAQAQPEPQPQAQPQAQTHPAPTRAQQIAEHSRKAEMYLQQKRPDLAIPQLQDVVRLDPSNVEAQANLGVLLFFRGQYADAVPALRTALRLHPGLTRIRALLGMSEEHTGDLPAAQKDLEAAFAALKEPKIQMQVGLSLVHVYRVTDHLEKAAQVISVLQQQQPTNPELIYIAYRLYSDLAGESMLSLSLVAPNSAQMHAVLAHENALQNKNEAAIAEYRKALAIDPKLPGADFELADLLRNANDVKQQAEAASIFQAALKANPYDEPSLVALGDMALKQGNFQQSRSYFDRALKINPNDSDANFGLAKTLIGMNQPKQALPILEKTVQLDPTNASAHFRLATLYRQQGRQQDARKQLEIFQRLHQLKDKLSAIYKKMHQESQQGSGGMSAQ
ncbi:MAG: tetratricopeptide repeat protein [Acidobacteriaceae bacterium]